MSEKLSERFAEAIDYWDQTRDEDGIPQQRGRFKVGDLAYQNQTEIFAALRLAEQPPTDGAIRDVSEERSPHVEGPRVEKFGGKYGGPGVLVASWTDEHGETMNIVAHRIEGGYGTFKHVYPAKLVRPQTPREPKPDIPTDVAVPIEPEDGDVEAMARAILGQEHLNDWSAEARAAYRALVKRHGG